MAKVKTHDQIRRGDPEMEVTVTPAYGRDYHTAEEVAADWTGGKDFILRDSASRWDGKACSCRDFGPGWTIKIRYGTVLNIGFLLPNIGFLLPNIVFIRGEAIIGRVDPDNL